MQETTRRGFMSSSAAAVAASTSYAAQAKPRSIGANDKIRVGVIGCRNRGTTDARLMLDSGQFEVVTMCDCDRGMLTKGMVALKDKCPKPPRKETDFRRVLEDKNVDAIINATPDHWHALITCMALDAGKHVYLEKPASYNIEDGKAMVAMQQKHPELVVTVGTQQRSGQHFRDAKAFIDGGGLGKVGFCRGAAIGVKHVVPVVPDSEPPDTLDYDMWLGPAPWHPYNKERVHYNWHYMRDTGTGRMGNWGAHWLDVIVWFMNLGFPKSAAAMGGQYVVHDAKELPDTQTVLYEYDGLTVLWEGRMWSRFGVGGGMGGGCEFSGEKGSILISRGGWVFYPRDGDAPKESHEGTGLDIPHVTNFAKAIRGEAKPNAPIDVGCKSAALCHLGNMATLLGRRLEFDAESQDVVGDAEAKAMQARVYRDPWKLPG